MQRRGEGSQFGGRKKQGFIGNSVTAEDSPRGMARTQLRGHVVWRVPRSLVVPDSRVSGEVAEADKAASESKWILQRSFQITRGEPP